MVEYAPEAETSRQIDVFLVRDLSSSTLNTVNSTQQHRNDLVVRVNDRRRHFADEAIHINDIQQQFQRRATFKQTACLSC